VIHIRRVNELDARGLADLLNEIRRHLDLATTGASVTPAMMLNRFATRPTSSAWHLAEDDSGLTLGLQTIEPCVSLPPDSCDIATFLRPGQSMADVGARLFDVTRNAARRLGYARINATLQAENKDANTYYQSRGFETYAQTTDQNRGLDDHTGKVSKRFDL
jgi:GNAT superfamily N-acetyltransferase